MIGYSAQRINADFFITIQPFLAENFFFDVGVFSYLLYIKVLTDKIIFHKNHYMVLTSTLQYHILKVMDIRLFNNWATQLRKGMLELCILNAIKDSSLYGYDIVRKLRNIEGLLVTEGTIYPILSRLKREGLVRTEIKESTEGPPRKYYEITTKGGKILSEMNNYWNDIKAGTDALKHEGK